MKGVGFSKSAEGFLQCQHCDQLLKMKRQKFLFPVYEKPFYKYLIVLFALFSIVLIAVVNYGVPSFIDTSSGSYTLAISIGTILFVFTCFIVPYASLSSKYAVYERVTEDELNVEEKVNDKYRFMFINFFILALLGGMLLYYLLSNYVSNMYVFLSVTLAYLVITMGTGIRIIELAKMDLENEDSSAENLL
ncbi:MAG: hypothetical protein WD059_09145 [Balneolaceae bacterium]